MTVPLGKIKNRFFLVKTLCNSCVRTNVQNVMKNISINLHKKLIIFTFHRHVQQNSVISLTYKDTNLIKLQKYA